MPRANREICISFEYNFYLLYRRPKMPIFFAGYFANGAQCGAPLISLASLVRVRHRAVKSEPVGASQMPQPIRDEDDKLSPDGWDMNAVQ